MSAAKSQVFVLIGASAGATILVNGHQFEDGVYHFQGNAEQVDTLTRIFSYYGAVPEEEAKRMAMEKELEELRANRAASAPVNEQPVKQPEQPAKDELKDAPAADAKMSLGEAIGCLNPENDAHWTSNNLPSLDALESLTGKKPTRDEVNALADGYTRAKARAVRAS